MDAGPYDRLAETVRGPLTSSAEVEAAWTALWISVQVLGGQADVARMALLELREQLSMRPAVAYVQLLTTMRATARAAESAAIDLECALFAASKGRRTCGCPITVESCNCPPSRVGGAR